MAEKRQHQGSLESQLRELRGLANEHGLYDAADWMMSHADAATQIEGLLGRLDSLSEHYTEAIDHLHALLGWLEKDWPSLAGQLIPFEARAFVDGK